MTSYFGTAVPDPSDPNFWRRLHETPEQRADRLREERTDQVQINCPHPHCYDKVRALVTTDRSQPKLVLSKIEFEHAQPETRHAHLFSDEFQKAVFKALGLEGRKVRRLILTLEVDKPITLQIDSFATFPDGQPYILADLFTLASFNSTNPEKETH